MQEEYRNIYKTARKTAGLTQERWAEQLDISVESVRLYETGGGLPSDEVVVRMTEVAATLPVLGYWHLINKSRMAAKLLPEVKICELPQAVIQLICRIREFSRDNCVDELLHIAEDGRIDPEEKLHFDRIVRELDGVVQAAMTLKFAKGGCDNDNIG